MMSKRGKEIIGYTDLQGSTDVKWAKGATVTNLTAENGAEITLYVLFDPTVYLGEDAFIIEDGVISLYRGSEDAKITLPNTATKIADGAFAYHDELTEVVVPRTYTEIGFGAFEGCDSLEKLTVPFIGGGLEDEDEDNDYLAYIFGASSYSDNSFTYSMIVENNSASIDESTLAGSFYIPKTLRVVNINNEIEKLGEGAFYQAFGLEKVNLLAFKANSRLEAFYSIKEVGAHAFEGCHRLGLDTEINANLSMPWLKDVEVFGDYSFAAKLADNRYFMSNLMYVGELTSAVTIGAHAFEYNRAADLSFGENLVSIGEEAFTANIFMQRCVIPDSVQTIGAHAFAQCDYMASVEIGTGVNDIGQFAFGASAGLREVIFRGDQAISLGDRAFVGLDVSNPDRTELMENNCNVGLKFWFETEQGRTANLAGLNVYTNAEKNIISPSQKDDKLYYYLAGSEYAFTASFSDGNTVIIHDDYNRTGFGLPYMVGNAKKVDASELYIDEDIYVVTFMADQFAFYLKKTVTYTGLNTHYYSYVVPSIDFAQIEDGMYAEYVNSGKTDAVTFGSEEDEWCVKENIFGQITLYHNGEQIQLGHDAYGNPLEEEAIIAAGGVAESDINHAPRTITYLQGNMYFEPILNYYFTYIPDESDEVGTGVYNGTLVLDVSKSDMGEYGNMLHGDYVSGDGEATLYVDEVSGKMTFGGTLRDGKTINFDNEFTAADKTAYGKVKTEADENHERTYFDYEINDLTTSDGKTVSVTFKDFYARIKDMQDSKYINIYAVCDVTYEGTTYRFYNTKYSSRQECYSLHPTNGSRLDCYTLITYEYANEIINADGQVINEYSVYPGYVEYVNGNTFRYGACDTVYSETSIAYSFTWVGTVPATAATSATITDMELGIFEARFNNTMRTYVPYYEEEAGTFTKDDITITLDGYGNGTYTDGSTTWKGKYTINTNAAVANVYISERTYYTMFEFTLVSNDNAHTVYFAPNFYDSYDGTMLKGDMIMPDHTRNKTYVSRVQSLNDGELYTSLLACSGYGLAAFYILINEDGLVTPINYAQLLAPGITYANYENIGGNKYLITNTYGDGFFICEFTEDMIKVNDRTSYREMVIDSDYSGWWYARAAVQVVGNISPNIYQFPRLCAREEMGEYVTPDGYKLVLDGVGGAELYDTTDAKIAEGSFDAHDSGQMGPTKFAVDMTLLFGDDETGTTFKGDIYVSRDDFEGAYIFAEVTLPDGKKINGFAKQGAIKAQYTAADGSVLTVYKDNYASIYKENASLLRGMYSAYEANPDQENALDKVAVSGDNLFAIRTSDKKVVVSTDDANKTFAVAKEYGKRTFATGFYSATVYYAYTEGEKVDEDDPESEYYEKVTMFGRELRGLRNGGVVVPDVNPNSEYVSSGYMFFTDEFRENNMNNEGDFDIRGIDYYYYWGNMYDTTWTLYEDGEYVIDYVYLGIIATTKNGWYYEVGEDEEKESYFIVDYGNGIVKYTRTHDHNPYLSQG